MESLVISILDFLASLVGTSPDLIQHWTTGRPRLRVVVLKDDPEIREGCLEFEVENVGEEPTSLDPVVIAIFLTDGGESSRITFDVQESDLSLPAFTPKRFTAFSREKQPERSHVRSKCYVFRQTNGSPTELRI